MPTAEKGGNCYGKLIRKKKCHKSCTDHWEEREKHGKLSEKTEMP